MVVAAGFGMIVVVLLPVAVLKDGDPFLLDVDGDVPGCGFVGGAFPFRLLRMGKGNNEASDW